MKDETNLMKNYTDVCKSAHSKTTPSVENLKHIEGHWSYTSLCVNTQMCVIVHNIVLIYNWFKEVIQKNRTKVWFGKQNKNPHQRQPAQSNKHIANSDPNLYQ